MSENVGSGIGRGLAPYLVLAAAAVAVWMFRDKIKDWFVGMLPHPGEAAQGAAINWLDQPDEQGRPTNTFIDSSGQVRAISTYDTADYAADLSGGLEKVKNWLLGGSMIAATEAPVEKIIQGGDPYQFGIGNAIPVIGQIDFINPVIPENYVIGNAEAALKNALGIREAHLITPGPIYSYEDVAQFDIVPGSGLDYVQGDRGLYITPDYWGIQDLSARARERYGPEGISILQSGGSSAAAWHTSKLTDALREFGVIV